MSRHTVTYASDYLIPGVNLPGEPGFHQIALIWNRRHPETQGSCHLDPNACGLDEFGDPTICTRMAVTPRDMELSLFSEKPEHRAFSMKWRVQGSATDYTDVPLRLVTIDVPDQPMRVRLLVLGTDRSIARIIELHEQHRS